MHRERKGRDNCLIFAILNRMVGAGLPEKVTLEERLLGGAGSESCRYEREENSREMKGFHCLGLAKSLGKKKQISYGPYFFCSSNISQWLKLF